MHDIFLVYHADKDCFSYEYHACADETVQDMVAVFRNNVARQMLEDFCDEDCTYSIYVKVFAFDILMHRDYCIILRNENLRYMSKRDYEFSAREVAREIMHYADHTIQDRLARTAVL